MINLKKHDPVADAVSQILQQEALKGNQDKIDANHNGKIDAQDFKILRGKKKVEEELKGNQDKIDANHNGKIDGEDFKLLRAKKKMKEEIEQQDEAMSHQAATTMKHIPNASPALKKAAKDIKPGVGGYRDRVAMLKAGGVAEEIDINDRTKDTLIGREKTKQKDDVGPNSNAKVTKFKLKSEEVKQIDEISTSTLGSYLDKRKSEYMKGKTQSGSKENAKKIQNMGKAYDKIKVQDLAKARQNNMEEVEQLDEYGEPSKYDSFKKTVGSTPRPTPSKENKGNGRTTYSPTLKQMKEKFEEPVLDELINEVMAKDASAGDYIHDFIHSDNPKFAGKSKAKRKEMALAAYYSKKNEEAVNEGLKDLAKKSFKALTGGSDKDHLDRLKKDMYGGSEVKYAAKTLVKHAKDPLGLKKEEVEQIDESFEELAPSKHGSISVNSKVTSPKEGFHKGEHVGIDTLIHKGTVQHKDNSKPTKFEVHNHVNRGLTFQTHHSDEEKQAIKQHLVKNKYAGKGTDIHEEVEQIDELSKDTLKSYRVNSIGRSSSFEKRGYEAAKKDGGAGNDKADKLFNKADLVASARKRAQDKMREEVEQIDEKNVPTSPEKWAKAKSAAKSKFAVYPSAYANGWASKKYKSMGGGWKAEEVEHVEEGWDDMVKSAQEKVKSGPKPNGGSGKKEGSAYGGSKQKEKPEHEMKEAKDPTMDAGCGSPPNFATNDAKPMKVAQTMAKKSLARMRSEMLGKTGTSE